MQSKTYLTVRYAETDQMGIVHHSNYPIWFEVGRTEFLKSLGTSYSGVEDSGVILPLFEINCQFKSPAKYEDNILIITSIKSLSRVRVCFSYEVLNVADNKLLATGETMHAWTDKALNPVNAEKKIPELYSMLTFLCDKVTYI